jgi:hypothetical protein
MTGLTSIKEAFLGKELTHLNKVSQKSRDQGQNAICQTCLGEVLKYKERSEEIERAVYESATSGLPMRQFTPLESPAIHGGNHM